MEFVLREIYKPTEGELSGIVALWAEAFGDDENFIRSFYERMPVSSTVCILDGERIVSMALLLKAQGAYYGYAVSTLKEYRGKGLCKMIHEYIKEKCERENLEYIIHPADKSLESFYEKLGMKTVSSYYEVSVTPEKNAKLRSIDESEYSYMRDLYFGGYRYCGWGVDALKFMKDSGIEFLSCSIDGVECAAAVDSGTILELCAPDDLFGKAASAFLPEGGMVRFFSSANHIDNPGIMSFSGKEVYFNLFLE